MLSAACGVRINFYGLVIYYSQVLGLTQLQFLGVTELASGHSSVREEMPAGQACT